MQVYDINKRKAKWVLRVLISFSYLWVFTDGIQNLRHNETPTTIYAWVCLMAVAAIAIVLIAAFSVVAALILIWVFRD